MPVVRAYILARPAAEQERLRSLVASPDIAVVGQGDSLETMAETRPDVAILSSDALSAGAGRHRLPPLVIWTDDVNTPARVRSWGLASWGVVGRRAPSAQLQAAVLAVAHGLCVVPLESVGSAVADAASGAGQDEDADAVALQEPLTARERDVLEIASRGLSNREVGAALGISEHTVKFHLVAIYAKLGVSTRTAAVRRGLRRGLIAI
jgi:DNA-binding NarL/FixJ family response regulator